MAESSETTPLLTDPSTGPSGGQNEQTNTLLPNSTVEPPAPYTRATFILTWLSIALSVLTFGFTAAIAIMDQYSPHDYYMDWQIRESCQIMIGLVGNIITILCPEQSSSMKWSVTSIGSANLLISSLERLRGFHLLPQPSPPVSTSARDVALEPDRRRHRRFLLCWLLRQWPLYDYKSRVVRLRLFVGSLGSHHPARLRDADLWSVCEEDSDPSWNWIRFWVGNGVSSLPIYLVLSYAENWPTSRIVHTILFLIRCVLAYRWIFQQGPNKTWRFPTGQLTVEFTIKFLRQDETVGSLSGEE